jgi:hypothetical protein
MNIQILDAPHNSDVVVACNVFDDSNERIFDERVDPRLTFLARAAARLELVEGGELPLDDAFDGLVRTLTPSTDSSEP